jgi:hypothetical protein
MTTANAVDIDEPVPWVAILRITDAAGSTLYRRPQLKANLRSDEAGASNEVLALPVQICSECGYKSPKGSLFCLSLRRCGMAFDAEGVLQELSRFKILAKDKDAYVRDRYGKSLSEFTGKTTMTGLKSKAAKQRRPDGSLPRQKVLQKIKQCQKQIDAEGLNFLGHADRFDRDLAYQALQRKAGTPRDLYIEIKTKDGSTYEHAEPDFDTSAD